MAVGGPCPSGCQFNFCFFDTLPVSPWSEDLRKIGGVVWVRTVFRVYGWLKTSDCFILEHKGLD